MSPQTIPWILCGGLCVLPVFLMIVTFQFLSLVTNRHFALERSVHVDKNQIKHVHMELTWLTREERKLHGRKEVEE